MYKLKKITTVFAIAMMGITAIPQITVAKEKPDYCEEAFWECRDKVVVEAESAIGEWVVSAWNVGAQYGCSVGYNNCG